MIQHCFLYCSLYPEDRTIVKDGLVRKFISDGLLDERRSMRAQVEQGHSILDKLVNLCLLESCINYKNEESVKMHDLVRSMALRICKGKYMDRAGEKSLMEIPNQEEWTEDLEKASFMFSGIKRIGEGNSPDCPKLSTMLMSWNNMLKVIPESFFSKMQGLCTLDLSWSSQIAVLPDSISDMTRLKALLLEGCGKLESMPYLGKMKALRELNLSGMAIKAAPEGLEELLNLRFLSMHANGLKMLPRGVLLKFKYLQHLDLPIDIQVETEEIESMKELEEFGGVVRNVSDFNRFITTCGVQHDPYYKIGVNLKDVYGSILGLREDFGWHNNKMLVLCESKLYKDEKVLGKGVVDLRIWRCGGLSSCFEDDLCERFDYPTSLKELSIQSCGGIEWIMRSGDGEASQLSATLEAIELKELERGDIPIR